MTSRRRRSAVVVQNMAMEIEDRKAARTPLLDRLRLALADPALPRAVLQWILPLMFAALISAIIRNHSLVPAATMSRDVGNLLTVGALGLIILMMCGRRLSVSLETTLLLLALTISTLISVMGSGGPDPSLLRLQIYLATAILAMAVYLAYRESAHIRIEAWFLGIALAHLPFLLSATLWIKDLEPPFWQDGHRVGHFGNVRQYAEFAYLAAASGTALGVLSRRLLVPALILAAGGVFGIVLTGSRGALLSWILFVVLLAGLSRARLRAAVTGVLVLASCAVAVWYLDRSGILASPNIFGRIANEAAGTESLDASRLKIWLSSLQQITVHPLFGSGPEGYWLSGCCDRRIMQAHNFVLQFLMEFGLVGCGILMLLALRAVKGLGGIAGTIDAAMATPANRVLTCLLASFLAYSLIDQMMYHLVPLVHLGVFAGLYATGLVQASLSRRHKSG